MPSLSYGLNITKKGPSSSSGKPAATKRRPIFDDDSAPEDDPDVADDNAELITSVGGLQSSAPHQRRPGKPEARKSPGHSTFQRISKFGDLSTNHTTSKHAQTAQSLDPSIYDYDAVYDSLHANVKSSGNPSSAAAADDAKKPKYMQSLLAAAETRKRDQLRAKDKMLAKERELEGDEFADKEKFVTAAYKRQQEEVRKAETEEAQREREAAERQRREGGGLKGMYKYMLERDEEKHAAALKSAQEATISGSPSTEKIAGSGEGKKEKSEAELAKEKGAVVNEEGQVVDKRQLLNAGLNAGAAAKPRAAAPARAARESPRGGRAHGGDRRDETKAFEDQLLGKRGMGSGGDDDDDDDTDGRASKSRKMEDEILASLGL
ncbi:MAG: hypothetical protein L6R40_002215 [Gallowayella cf. fulva]|nr:MAG: hypothetical protein L6R40_002215 [Xanthomendoza cf. fulva]